MISIYSINSTNLLEEEENFGTQHYLAAFSCHVISIYMIRNTDCVTGEGKFGIEPCLEVFASHVMFIHQFSSRDPAKTEKNISIYTDQSYSLVMSYPSILSPLQIPFFYANYLDRTILRSIHLPCDLHEYDSLEKVA